MAEKIIKDKKTNYLIIMAILAYPLQKVKKSQIWLNLLWTDLVEHGNAHLVCD